MLILARLSVQSPYPNGQVTSSSVKSGAEAHSALLPSNTPPYLRPITTQTLPQSVDNKPGDRIHCLLF